jgi:hypothetical protein
MPAAAWIEEGQMSFVMRRNTEAASLALSGGSGDAKVPTIHLAPLLRSKLEGTNIAFLKMDVEGAEYDLFPDLVRRDALCSLGFLSVEWHYDKATHVSWTDRLALRYTLGGLVRQRCGSNLRVQNDDCKWGGNNLEPIPTLLKMRQAHQKEEWQSLIPVSSPLAAPRATQGRRGPAVSAVMDVLCAGRTAAESSAGCFWWQGSSGQAGGEMALHPGRLLHRVPATAAGGLTGGLAWYVDMDAAAGVFGARLDCGRATGWGVFPAINDSHCGVWCGSRGGAYLFVNASAVQREHARFSGSPKPGYRAGCF